MSFVLASVTALLATLIVGAASKFIIGLLAPARPARFGGFCLALGFALGHYLYSGVADRSAAEAASAAFGAALAVLALWYWFKPRTTDASHAASDPSPS